MSAPTVIAYGGGVNSDAVLVGLRERGERPDLILFADTGSEKPETIRHVAIVSKWLVSHGWPEIVVVRWIRQDGSFESVEDNCLRLHMLPSIAYGHKGCSVKWKRQPQDKFVADWQPAIDAWARGERVVKLIGYDADEHHRAKIPADEHYTYRYPLVEWGWGRAECVEAIKRGGLPMPPKSACFLCPSMRKMEVLTLAKTHPDLFARAVAVEAGADLTDIAGLGRRFSWKQLADADARQLRLIPEPPIDAPCGCYDGDDSDAP